MMRNNYLHTVEGVRDIHPLQAGLKFEVERRIMDMFADYGYKRVETPTFEYYDIYRYERGTLDNRSLYKFFNREGDILALRPDVTPSIARYVATYYDHLNELKRLSYVGNVYINNPNYQGKLREYTQCGVECIGLDSIETDAESIALAIKALKQVGLSEFKIDIGHVGVFNGLAEAAGLTADVKEQVRRLVDEKNHTALADFLKEQNLTPTASADLLALPDFFGDLSMLDQALATYQNSHSKAAINHIKQVCQLLEQYDVTEYLSFDLGMVNQLDYYTGIIFKGYTYDVGNSIVDGGRYDDLISTFTRQIPAVGFAIKIDDLLAAFSREIADQAINRIDTLLYYPSQYNDIGIRLGETLRSQGMRVEVAYNIEAKDLADYGIKEGIGGLMKMIDSDTVELMDLASRQVQTVSISQLGKNPEQTLG